MSDLISRQAAIDELNAKYHGMISDESMKIYQIINWLDNLPSAEPKRGKWILAKEQRQEDTENGNYMYNCSNCDYGDLHSKAVKVSYCWNCGADMRGEQDE